MQKMALVLVIGTVSIILVTPALIAPMTATHCAQLRGARSCTARVYVQKHGQPG